MVDAGTSGNFFAGEVFADLADAQALSAGSVLRPADKTGYAMRDLTRLTGTAAGHGPNIGIYAERLLDHDLP